MTAYDANGNIVSEAGATYPVRYAYDSQSRRVAMWTNRSGDEWDMTRWAYDPATGLCTSKTYSDGSVVTYEYTPDGLLERTRTADGHWTRNIYDARRQLVGVQYDDASNVTYVRDAYGRESSAANGNAAYAYTLAPCGIATGESVTIGVTNCTLLRGLDNQGRITSFGIENPGPTSCLSLAYRPDGRIGSVTNDEVTVDYAYSDDGYDTGYTLAVEGGATFVRTLVRDPYRRDLVTAVGNSQGADYAYSYDVLSRPTTRNDDVFAYNARSEVTGATAAGEVEVYIYDNIGNATFASAGSVTNTYAANRLNQYVAVSSGGVTVEPVYDADGNLVSFGDWSYAYDSAARLTEVRSNGVLVASNYYDHQGRRIRLVTQSAAHTFVYDGWNVVLELVEHDGVTDRIEYYWGKDISGSLQGAGGVGGLLYLKRNGSIFVPIYDAYGNVMEYRAADGSFAASYVYDAFGHTVSQTGSLADVFRFRYSTKSYERESGLYYYGKRFYSPILRRWLNRDPLEERGGLNLYVAMSNASVFSLDFLGCKVIVQCDANPSDRDFIKGQPGKKPPRAVTRIYGSCKFSCDTHCRIKVTGHITLWMEKLESSSPRWGEQFKQYEGMGRENSEADAMAHEMDHYTTWLTFLNFVKTANNYEGRSYGDCEKKAAELNARYKELYGKTQKHSLNFDKSPWNKGGQYYRHPLDASMLKWE